MCRIKRKTKVLIVGGFPDPSKRIFGGIVSSCLSLMDSSFPEKFNVMTIDTTQISNPIPPLWIRLIFAAKRNFRYALALLFQRPQLVILFSAIGASLFEKAIMAWIAFILRIPVFMFPRGGPLLDQVKSSKLTSMWVRWAFGAATRVLCQGPAWQDFATTNLMLPKDRAPIIFNWTATEDLLQIGREKIKRASDTPLRLLYLGWLEEEKGIYDFLFACNEVAKEQNFTVSIAGEGNCSAVARDIVASMEIEDRVTFHGWVTGQELQDIMRISNILVLPSWAEGFPNAVVEAMAAGLAVIATTVGNIPEILNDGQEAILVSPKDRGSLVRAIAKVLSNSDLRVMIANNGHYFAEKNFSADEASRKLEKLINSTV